MTRYPKKVCFFAHVPHRSFLELLGFYNDDIEILKRLGYQVVLATKPWEIPWNCDLYVAWWFGWGTVPLWVARLVGKPIIIIGAIHVGDVKFGFHQRPLYERFLMKWSLRHADAALLVSKIEYEGARSLGARNPHLVYHGVSYPQQTTPLDGRMPLVFSIGHLSGIGIARKRFDNVIRAIPLVCCVRPDVKFVMAGPIQRGFYLDKLAASLGVEDKVHFPGPLDHEVRNRYYHSALVFAQPAEYEGFGLAQLEAMSFGLPVVSSAGGAVPEVLGDAGLYCDQDSPEDIAAKIIALLSEPALWNRSSVQGRARALNLFPIHLREQKIQEVIERIILTVS